MYLPITLFPIVSSLHGIYFTMRAKDNVRNLFQDPKTYPQLPSYTKHQRSLDFQAALISVFGLDMKGVLELGVNINLTWFDPRLR